VSLYTCHCAWHVFVPQPDRSYTWRPTRKPLGSAIKETKERKRRKYFQRRLPSILLSVSVILARPEIAPFPRIRLAHPARCRRSVPGPVATQAWAALHLSLTPVFLPRNHVQTAIKCRPFRQAGLRLLTLAPPPPHRVTRLLLR